MLFRSIHAFLLILGFGGFGDVILLKLKSLSLLKFACHVNMPIILIPVSMNVIIILHRHKS